MIDAELRSKALSNISEKSKLFRDLGMSITGEIATNCSFETALAYKDMVACVESILESVNDLIGLDCCERQAKELIAKIMDK